jgi:lycopene cyclase domain-containing protein
MKALYLILNLGSVLIPFLYSFHPKLKLNRQWASILSSIALMMMVFIPWDVIFTQNGVWGFNPAYFIGIEFFDLPLEEWLFFICIPYACIFTHFALLHYFPNIQIHKKLTQVITYVLIVSFLGLSLFNHDKSYTFVNFGYAAIITTIVLLLDIELLSKYYLSFIIILIPFFWVNGVLTGSFIEDQVVWYNNRENLGIRIFTIPVEDMAYAFSMILTPLFLQPSIEKLFRKQTVN